MSEVKPWLAFGCFVVFAVAAAPVSCVMHANQKIADMVEAGASPTEARCAIGSLTASDATSVQCLTAALLKAQK